ncbi:hypothetical protein [Nocardia niwae]|uniref:DUF4062 domain-containing protein n=1 Tax=Nocardia niwae TaxID=626084 RepID=A0ABV2X4J1_9NOCA
MGFDAHVLKVLIASPGDTMPERDAIERGLMGWNGSRAENCGVAVIPWRWENNAVPMMGGSPQSVINAQAVDSCDIVLAVFDSRLGTATENAVSGTAEEITRAHKAGKPVHVWVSEAPIPRSASPEELQRLQDFKNELRTQGLLGTYTNPESLQYQVHQAVEHDVTRMGLGPVNLQSAKAVQARAVTARVTPNPLGDQLWNVTVRNDSASPISDLSVDVYLVDVRGRRVAGQCVPAKGRQTTAELIDKAMDQMLRGGLKDLGPGIAEPVADHLMPPLRAEMFKHIQANMIDSFPTIIPAHDESAVVYATEGTAEVRVDIQFADAAGQRWIRTHGQPPAPAA